MTQGDPPQPQRDLLGQPRGLWVLAGTELWDRISFHGMQAMLVLYMTGELLLDQTRLQSIIGYSTYRGALETVTGPLSNTALATQTFGIYIAFVSGLPLLGGWLGDRLLGRRLSVGAGAALMTAGHFCMAFDPTFLIALVLIMSGAGLLRGNLSAQVKSLYRKGDPREINAFQYYSLSVSFGGFIAPIVSGAVAAVWGWHAGFGVAGFGMLLGFGLYLAGGRHLPAETPRRSGTTSVAHQALTPDERRRVIGLFLLWPISVCFWIAQAQIWNIYNVWLRDHIDMNVGGFQVPVPWMQSLDGLAPAVLALTSLWVWARMAKSGAEPDPLNKMAVGLLIFGASVGLLAAAPIIAGGDGKASIVMPILFHLFSNLGWVWFTPVVLALYAARSPERWRGTLLGFNALSLSAASIISGWMGGLYEQLAPSSFWLINAVICSGAGVVLLLTRRPFGRLLALPPESQPT
ncbi:peptide MFS transporter [Novosphingobium sp.]|uniref:peptide MFS transporter n=1 Tax=Novosphingobium sp. TaxID=1874826 RepID=UPI00286C0BD2|nr:peptide MFS transporter [Novosphingobium sp.]